MALQEPRADHRPVRRRRRAHPGGRGGARRLRRGVPAQRAGLRRHPADLGHHGAVRGRRRLLAGDDRLHLHGAGHELHVRHRPRRGEDGDERDRDGRGARRRQGAHDEVLDRRPRLRQRRRGAAADAPAHGLPALQQPVRRARAADDRRPRPRSTSLDTLDPRQPEQALRHEGADPQGRRRGRFLRDPGGVRENIVTGFARMEGRTVGIVANQPMVLAGVLDAMPRARPRASCASATASRSRS